MADNNPPKSGRRIWTVWKVAIVVASGVVLTSGVLVAALLFDSEGPDTTEVSPGAVSPTAPATAASPTASISPPTSTPQAVFSTASPTIDENPFVGRWTAAALDGSQLDLRVGPDGAFMHWDSASRDCRDQGFAHSPETWAGSTTVELADQPSFIDDMVGEGANLVPRLTITGSVVCYPYDLESGSASDRTLSFFYDQSRDALEPVSGGVRYARSVLVGGIPSDANNPFVGSWGATDRDGTRIVMSILVDGSWESSDTRSDLCEMEGLTYATWSARGSGTFDLAGSSVFEVAPIANCHPRGSEQSSQLPDVSLRFEYEDPSDTVVLSDDEIVYTRLP